MPEFTTRRVQLRTFPSTYDAIRKICIDKRMPFRIMMERIIHDEISFMHPLDAKYAKKIVPKHERLTSKLNFEISAEAWRVFLDICHRDYHTKPTARINALLNREILEHHINYLQNENEEIGKSV